MTTDFHRLNYEAATKRHMIMLNAGDLKPTGSSYDRWQVEALWALGQIAQNPDANQWTIIAAEIQDAVERQTAQRTAECPSDERLRELEWAATYLKTHKKRRCRCAGSCDRCKPYREAESKLTPDAVLELIRAVRGLSPGTGAKEED